MTGSTGKLAAKRGMGVLPLKAISLGRLSCSE
jgi:hypothetical protein